MFWFLFGGRVMIWADVDMWPPFGIRFARRAKDDR